MFLFSSDHSQFSEQYLYFCLLNSVLFMEAQKCNCCFLFLCSKNRPQNYFILLFPNFLLPFFQFPYFQVSYFCISMFPCFHISKFPISVFPYFQVSYFHISKFPISIFPYFLFPYFHISYLRILWFYYYYCLMTIFVSQYFYISK